MTGGEWAVSERDVMAAIRDSIDNPEAVLVTVVSVDGSAFRRPGAKMVISDGGDGVGSLTAGCLENDVLSLAERVRADGRPRVERFDLTGDDDVWGLGIGCNGVVDLLIEPLDDDYRPVVEAYERREHVAVVTALGNAGSAVEFGDRWIASPSESADDRELSVQSAQLPEQIQTAVADAVDLLLAADTSDTVTIDIDGASLEVFVESVSPPPELVVFGSQVDVVRVADLAAQAGFRVTVAAFRGAAADEERFPAADRVVATSPADLRAHLEFDSDTYAIVMSHNFVDDRLALDELLATPVPYVGLMGPRKRFEEMRDAFADEGRTFSPAELERIYTPTGLDLGGGTPFHIAQSIVAEVTAIHFGRDPKHLTDRNGPIHPRSPLDAESTEDT